MPRFLSCQTFDDKRTHGLTCMASVTEALLYSTVQVIVPSIPRVPDSTVGSMALQVPVLRVPGTSTCIVLSSFRVLAT